MDLRAAAEAASILAARRERDGLAQLELFKHQSRFLESQKSEAWLLGGNRSGKTEGLAALLASAMRFGDPDPRPAYIGGGNWIYDRAVRVWGVSLTSDMSRNILQAKMFDNGAGIGGRHPFIPQDEIADWNITNQTLKTKNGSVGIFKTCESGRDHFQGADVDIIGFDEVPVEDVYTECTIRVGGGRRLLIRGAATILPPPGQRGGVSWMYRRKIVPWLEAGKNDPNLDIITASIYDNTTITRDELARLEAQFIPGSPEYLIRMKGMLLPTIGGALCYPGFIRAYHVREELAPFLDGRRQPVISPYHPLVLSCDFNPEGGVWTVGQKVKDEFRVLDEIALERSNIPAMVGEFRSRYPSHTAELWIYGDATGRRRSDQTGESNFHLIQEYMQGYPAPLRFVIPDVNPPVTDRVNAVNRHLRSGDGRRLLSFSPLCVETVKDFESTKWKANGKIDKRGEHQSNGADCVGYWVAADAPTSRTGVSTGRLRTIRTPGGPGKHGVFPSAFSNAMRREGGKWVIPIPVGR